MTFSSEIQEPGIGCGRHPQWPRLRRAFTCMQRRVLPRGSPVRSLETGSDQVPTTAMSFDVVLARRVMALRAWALIK
ncbi:hypothetical protein KC19_4G145500 [Ceratodon purpureus]|uniref:Uncharacterized protein n=1 Tax=Ceratodon purpureus TaxID=3225 RepID=A0A8T0I9N4_CERPU|nr:hypothetical protein KC19_4G145500 [Ceratodon purpureus]